MGKSMAMVADGPIPGRTPINVPTETPIKHMNSRIGSTAREKPYPILFKRSMLISPKVLWEVEPLTIP